MDYKNIGNSNIKDTPKIAYKFALDAWRRLVHINEAERATGPFFCPACHAEMTARLGKVRVHHFAHLPGKACFPETYLHASAKEAFIRAYTGCLNFGRPFYLLLFQKVICKACEVDLDISCSSKKLQKYDLTEYYSCQPVTELDHGGFRPDVLLRKPNSDNVLFIEFAVTHRVEDQKISSKYKILEFQVTCEEDVQTIAELDGVSEANPCCSARFFNFKRETGAKTHKNFRCFGKAYDWIVVNSNYTCIIEKGLRPYNFKKKYLDQGLAIAYRRFEKFRGNERVLLDLFWAGYRVPILYCSTCNNKLDTDIMPGRLWCKWCGKEVVVDRNSHPDQSINPKSLN